jgi:streptogramin lyase
MREVESPARVARILAAILIIAACGISPVSHRLDVINREILGNRPSYGPTSISEVPNLAAIDRLIWMPGLDEGWDPQGLAVARGALFVSAYRSGGMWVDRGPCRVFRVDPETGKETGHFDVPRPCRHAGGLAYAGHGKLFVADTRTLFEVDLEQAFSAAPQFRIFPLGPGVKGAFAASGNGEIWIGDYEEARPARILKYALALFESLKKRAVLTADLASAVISIPSYAQGGALDYSGGLWVSRSDIGWGFLDRIDAATGHLEQRYPIAAGTEGIAFDENGRLWCVSEAGARHLPLHYPFFPLIFRLDPARLSPSD